MCFWSPILRQEFVLCPPLECQKLRLVCTRNAMAALKPTELLPRRGEDSMGLDGYRVFGDICPIFSGFIFTPYKNHLPHPLTSQLTTVASPRWCRLHWFVPGDWATRISAWWKGVTYSRLLG